MPASVSRGPEEPGAAPGRDLGGLPPHPPDAALGVWLSWMKGQMDPAGSPGPAVPGEHWLMGPDAVAGKMLSASTEQFRKMLASDPLLSAIDRMWNANPLHNVIPVDWAEVARALRTVWLRSLADPGRAITAAVELNAKAWSAAIEAWNSAANRWLGQTQATARPGLGPATSGSRRPNGTTTRPTGRSRTCTCWRPTFC